MGTVCPMGLCREEETCPNAPCLDCMRRLGDHMIAEIKIIEQQAKIANVKGDSDAYTVLKLLVSNLGRTMAKRETDQIVIDELLDNNQLTEPNPTRYGDPL